MVLESGKKVTEDELKGYVKANLARYKVPREIVFIDELPRNATGKVLKRELRGRGGGSRLEVGVWPARIGYALPRPRGRSAGMDTGAIIAIVVGALILLALLWCRRPRGPRAPARDSGAHEAREIRREAEVAARRRTRRVPRPTQQAAEARRQDALARERVGDRGRPAP